MIEPTKNDLGRKVVYRTKHAPVEEGVITSFNNFYVFVRFGSDQWSKATKRANLEWINGGNDGR